MKNNNYQTNTDKFIPQGFFGTIQYTLRQHGILESIAMYLMMKDEFNKFVQKGKSQRDKEFRKQLIEKFNYIQNKIACAHSPYQFILMADYIFNLKVSGPIIQCGCFKGGSTAKLSLLARKTKRRLYIYDSFQGLPPESLKGEKDLQGLGDFPNTKYAQGEYCGTLEEVINNVKQYGAIEVCEFIPGFFKDTLKKVKVKPAFVFTDVDYISSARDCLKHLWPSLLSDGYWFTHEASFPKYIQGILDFKWWKDNLNENPPIIYGGGSGLSPLARAIAYFQKT